MGFLDNLVSQAAGAATGGLSFDDPSHAGAAKGILEMLGSGAGGGGAGGMGGLLESLTKAGLGSAVASWVGTGANAPVGAAQLTQALGGPMVQQLAAKAGLSSEAIGPILAQVLPMIIDKLTPDGKVPEQSGLEQGLGMLKGMLGG